MARGKSYNQIRQQVMRIRRTADYNNEANEARVSRAVGVGAQYLRNIERTKTFRAGVSRWQNLNNKVREASMSSASFGKRQTAIRKAVMARDNQRNRFEGRVYSRQTYMGLNRG